QYSHCPARMRLTRPSGCETPDIVGPDRSPERAFASAGASGASAAHTGVSPVWPDAHRERKSAIMNTPAFSDSAHEPVNLPDKPALDGVRDKWEAAWSESEVYGYYREADREPGYTIHTSPPNTS